MDKNIGKKDKIKSNRRVAFFKKAIVAITLSLLVLPSILMIFVCIRLGNVERELQEFKEDVYGTHTEETNYSLAPINGGRNAQKIEAVESPIINIDETATDDSEEKEEVANENEAKVDVKEYDNVFSVDQYSGRKRICITFDDGPSVRTDEILDILNNYGIKATFFVNAKEGYESQYKRIVDEGHTLGMHSYSHNYQSVYNSLDSFADDLYSIQTFIKDTTGQDAIYYRFPGGSSNKVSHVDMKDCIEYLNAKGIIYYDWNVSAQDAITGGTTTKQIVNNVVNTIENGDSDTYVILMHDAQDKRTTVEALPVIIETLADKEDIVFTAIDENTELIQHVSVEEEN